MHALVGDSTMLKFTVKYLLFVIFLLVYSTTRLIAQTSHPNFTLSATTVCTNTTVTINNTSTIDNGCSNPVYTWDVLQNTGSSPAIGVSYASGNSHSVAPEFVFSVSGSYRIVLSISTSCGTTTSEKIINVQENPTATLSHDFSLCGKDYVLIFDSNADKTNTVLSGTPNPNSSTYTWTVTGPGNPVFEFKDGTDAHSQYPHIQFREHAIYTVTVTHSNACGPPAVASQKITFAEAPAVDAGILSPVCENSGPVQLTGKIEGLHSSYYWQVDAPSDHTDPGTLSATTGTLTPTYTPREQDFIRGYVTIRLFVTANAGDCSEQSDGIVLTFLKAPKITSVDKKLICSGDKVGYTITANEPTTFSWTATSTTATGFLPGSGNSINDVLINNNPAVKATVTYTIVATNANGCSSKPFELVVTIPAVPVAAPTKETPVICSAGPVNINLASNQDPVTTKYTWTSSGNGVTGNTNQAIPILVNNNKITDDVVNNTNAVVTVTYSIIPYNENGCPGTPVDISIDVNPITPTANAGPTQILCPQPTANLVANNPGTFTGTWTQVSGPPATITNPNNHQTTVTGLISASTYVFRWTITALAPCVDTQADVKITTNPDVIASYSSTAKVGCGDLNVSFTNTSTNQTGAKFMWNFGDGKTSNLASPQHLFAQRNDGRDTTYFVSLTVLDNCVQRAAIVDTIVVHALAPVISIVPSSTNFCGDASLEVRNTSSGDNLSYDFYLYNGNILVQKISSTSRSTVIFDQIKADTRKTYALYMVAIGYCGNIGETPHIPITISPSVVTAQMAIENGKNSGCAPLNINLVNNTLFGDSFFYTIYDANNNVVDRLQAGLTPMSYTFNKSGTFYVKLTATSNCGVNESAPVRINVSNTPMPAFVADVTSGCNDALVTFTNKTTSNDVNIPTTSLLYDWDFGDGSPHSSLFAPTHTYHFTGKPYTVTLRATNPVSGCSEIYVKLAYINLYGPPKTAFVVSPDSVTSIPNYTFSFIDLTSNDAVSWKWSFGDGQTSTRRNATVTYRDTGTYVVTLTTATALGCESTIAKKVRIGGVPGQLFLPNAFMPESSNVAIRAFEAKGSGIKVWQLQILRFGQVIWQTNKLNAKGEPDESWDGTINGTPLPQGVYQWKASATFINGSEWQGNILKNESPKRSGSVYLMR